MKATLWRRLAWLRSVFPLRFGGLLLLAAGLWVVVSFSTEESDYLLHPAGLVALILVAVTLVAVISGTISLRRAVRRLESGVSAELETTRERVTDFRPPRLRGWLVLDVGIEWLDPAHVDVDLEPRGAFIEECITPRARGRYTSLTRRFTVEDIFGLTRLTFTHTWSLALRIAPAPTPITSELAANRARGDTFSDQAGRPEGDLVEMRSYAHGDSMRHVLWKTYARTRRLLVRLPERALSPQPLSVAFLLAGEGDEPSAGTARLYVEQGLLGSDFLFAADGAVHPAHTAAEALEQIIDSASAKRDGGASLDSLAAQMDPSRLASCLFFAPAVDGPWKERLISLVHRLSLQGTVVIGVEEVPVAVVQPNRLRRLLFQTEPQTEEERQLPRVPQLRAALEAEGLKVQLVHRATGQVL